MSSQVAKKEQPKFSLVVQSDAYQNLINKTLGNENRAQNFVAAISSAVATNPTLQECDAGTIISGALLAESLKLAHSPQLGYYYLVPFNDRKAGIKKATFQLGYKGYIQLAMRSGQYQSIVVSEIKEGELIHYDPILETAQFEPIQNDMEREKTPTIGYFASFELINGFKKSLYWSKEKMEQHAMRYSAGYRAKKGYTFWETNFDAMGKKTMLKQLLSKWGVMSVEMQDMQVALEKDQAVINEDGSVEYIDNPNYEPVQNTSSASRANQQQIKQQKVAPQEVQVNLNDL